MIKFTSNNCPLECENRHKTCNTKTCLRLQAYIQGYMDGSLSVTEEILNKMQENNNEKRRSDPKN